MKVLWLPDFLKESQPARAALGVLVQSQQAKKGLSPEEYLASWESKVDRLLQAREKEQPGGVRQDLAVLEPPALELHGLEAESLRLALGNHHDLKDGLGKLLRYLRHPSQENKDDLLAVYPPDQALPPRQELQEQQNLRFLDLLLSL